jgi:hypothetical protein
MYKKDENSNYAIKAQIYRHSDGYPSAVIPDLKAFYEWYTSEPNARSSDPNYDAANFIYYMKLERYNRMLNNGKVYDGGDKLGYGVESVGNIHGDEEYLWRIVWDEVKYPNENEPRIYVATHFIDDKNLSFEQAVWHSYGTLSDAVKKCKDDELPSEVITELSINETY